MAVRPRQLCCLTAWYVLSGTLTHAQYNRIGVVSASWRADDAAGDAPDGQAAQQAAPPVQAGPRPYVAVALRTHAAGAVRQHHMQLTLAEFKARGMNVCVLVWGV